MLSGVVSIFRKLVIETIFILSLFVLASPLYLPLMGELEGRVLPVAVDVVIDTPQRLGAYWEIHPQYTKPVHRAGCEFVTIQGFVDLGGGVYSDVPVTFNDPVGTRPAGRVDGTQSWFLKTEYPFEEIKLDLLSKCNNFWITRTPLVR